MKSMKEFGRTTFEMLQVLAVMGLLSVASFFAYKHVMNKWRANELIYEGSERAVEVSISLGEGKQPDLRSALRNNQTAGGRFDYSIILDPENCQFGLRVFEVPKIVCQNAILMVGEKTHLRHIALESDLNTPVTECTPEQGDYVLVYSNDLGTTSVGCTALNIVNDCTGDQFKDSNGLCTSCSDSQAYSATEEECSKCSGRSMKDGQCVRVSCDEGQVLDSDGSCKSCSADGAYQISETECLRCPERSMKNGECVKKDCGAGFFKNAKGQCTDCSDVYVTEPIDASECLSCGNRRMESGYCYLNCPDDYFQNNNGNCTFCGLSATKETTPEQCNKCNVEGIPFKRTIDKWGKCSLNEPNCPDGYFKSSEDSYCRSCTDMEPRKVANEWMCTKCNTDGNQVRVYSSADSKCYPKVGNCPLGNFEGSDGLCHGCSKEKESYASTAEQCDQCSGQRVLSGGRCVKTPPDPSKCEDWQFQNSNGNCTNCALTAAKLTSEEQCAKCSQTTPFKRTVTDGMCGLSSCPSGYFRGKASNGDWLCTDCDDPGQFPVQNNDCSQCGDKRKVVYSKCVLAN